MFHRSDTYFDSLFLRPSQTEVFNDVNQMFGGIVVIRIRIFQRRMLYTTMLTANYSYLLFIHSFSHSIKIR